jgi:rhodanese-related sulfurtransferase
MTVDRALRVFAKGLWALAGVWFSPAGQAAESGLKRMKALVRERFPDVPHLTTAQLASWLTDPNRVPPLLLDVRTQAEFAVSHLAGARWIDPSTPPQKIIATLPADRPVVLYCAVGYRSAECATRLLRAGFTSLTNLEGSLFQWANEGRPLAADVGPASRVHPYSQRFGKLLKPELRAPATPLDS